MRNFTACGFAILTMACALALGACMSGDDDDDDDDGDICDTGVPMNPSLSSTEWYNPIDACRKSRNVNGLSSRGHAECVCEFGDEYVDWIQAGCGEPDVPREYMTGDTLREVQEYQKETCAWLRDPDHEFY